MEDVGVFDGKITKGWCFPQTKGSPEIEDEVLEHLSRLMKAMLDKCWQNHLHKTDSRSIIYQSLPVKPCFAVLSSHQGSLQEFRFLQILIGECHGSRRHRSSYCRGLRKHITPETCKNRLSQLSRTASKREKGRCTFYIARSSRTLYTQGGPLASGCHVH